MADEYDYSGGYSQDEANSLDGFDRAINILSHKASIAVNTGKMTEDAAMDLLNKKIEALRQFREQYGDKYFDSIKAPKSLKATPPDFSDVNKADFSDVKDDQSYSPYQSDILGNISSGFQRGMDTAARGLLMAGAGYESLTPQGIAAKITGAPDPLQDQMFNIAENLRKDESTLKAPITRGEKIAQGAGGFIPGLLSGGAGAAGASGQDILAEGGNIGQAETALGIDAAANIAGLGVAKYTGGLGLGSRLLAQGAAGGAAEEGARLTKNQLLDERFRQEFDPVTFGMSVGSGALGGILPGEKTGAKGDINPELLREPSRTGDPDIDAGIKAGLAEQPLAQEIPKNLETPAVDKTALAMGGVNETAEPINDAVVPKPAELDTTGAIDANAELEHAINNGPKPVQPEVAPVTPAQDTTVAQPTKEDLRKNVLSNLGKDAELPVSAEGWDKLDSTPEYARDKNYIPFGKDTPSTLKDAATNGRLTSNSIIDAWANNHDDLLPEQDHQYGQQIQQRLQDLGFSKSLGDAPVIRDVDRWLKEKGAESPAVASYQPMRSDGSGHYILVNPFLTEIPYKVLRHEAVHAVEHSYIQAGYDGKLSGQSLQAFNFLKNLLDNYHKDLMDAATARKEENLQDEGARFANKQFTSETYGLSKYKNGTPNLHEFSAEFSASPTFRAALEKMPIDNIQAAKLGAGRLLLGKVRNMYEAVRNGFNRLIGTNQNLDTARDALAAAHADLWNKLQDQYRNNNKDPLGTRKVQSVAYGEQSTSDKEDNFIPAKGTGLGSRILQGTQQLSGFFKTEPQKVIQNAMEMAGGSEHAAGNTAKRLLSTFNSAVKEEKVPLQARADFNSGKDLNALDAYPKTKAAAIEYYNERQKGRLGIAGGLIDNPNARKADLRMADAVAANPFYEARTYESDRASQARADLARKADAIVAQGGKLTPEQAQAKQVVDNFKEWAKQNILPQGLDGNEKRANLNYRAKALGLDPAAIVDKLPKGATSADKKAAIIDALNKEVPNEEAVGPALDRLVDYATGKSKSPNSPLVRISRGASLGDIMKSKQNVPPELRAIWGEHTNPETKMVNTLIKQGAEAGKINALNYIRDNGVGRFLHDGTPKTAPEGYTVQLKGAKYGPLRGMYTTPEVERLLKSTVEVNTAASSFLNAIRNVGMEPKGLADWISNRIGAPLRWTVRTGKVLQQGIDPLFYIQNLMGGPQMALSNGVVPFGKTAWEGFASHLVNTWPSLADSKVFKDMGISDTIKKNADLVARSGIGESSQVSEYQRELESKAIADILKNEDYKTLAEKATAMGKAFVNFAPKTAMKALGVMDGWARDAAFLQRYKFLDKMYNDLGQAPDRSDKIAYQKYENNLIAEAGDKAKNTTLFSRRNSPMVQFAERHGISRGLLFEAEAWRNGYNSLAYGISDIQRGIKLGYNPLIAEGVKQLAGTAASLLPMYARMSLYSALLKGIGGAALGLAGYATKDVERDDKRQGYLQQPGSWLAGQDLQEIVTSDPNAKYYWSPADINQYYYPVTRLVDQITNLAADYTNGKDIDKARELQNAISTYTDTFFRDRTLNAIYHTVTGKVPGWIEKAENTQYFDDQMAKYTDMGMSKEWARRMIVMNDLFTSGATRAQLKADVSTATPDAKSLMAASIGVSRVKNDADLSEATGSKLNSGFKDAIAPMNDVMSQRGNLSDSTIERTFVQSMKDAAKQTKLLSQDYDYAEATGLGKEAAAAGAAQKGINKTLLSAGLDPSLTPAYLVAQNVKNEAMKQLKGLQEFPSRQEALQETYAKRFELLGKLVDKYGKMTPAQIENL